MSSYKDWNVIFSFKYLLVDLSIVSSRSRLLSYTSEEIYEILLNGVHITVAPNTLNGTPILIRFRGTLLSLDIASWKQNDLFILSHALVVCEKLIVYRFFGV